MKYVWIFMIAFLSCRFQDVESQKLTDCVSKSAENKKTAEYSKDSNYLVKIIGKWIDSSYSWYSHYKSDTSVNIHSKIHIGDLFYSPDKLKLTGFIYVEYTSDSISSKNPKATRLFDSHTIMGYRDFITQKWKVFNLNEIFFSVRNPTLYAAQKSHRNIFLNKIEMTERGINVFDPLTGKNTKIEKINYLPCGIGYWENSPLWKKGNRVPGYYSFETFMNSTPENRTIRPHVQ